LAAELLDDLFFSERAEPAWHSIMKSGIDPTRTYTAIEVLDVLGGPNYVKLPLQTIATKQDGAHIMVPAYAIIRTPYGTNKTEATMGIVREGYNLVTPEQVAQMWDDRTGKAVETAAYLREGKLFLLTAKLNPVDVVGDTVQMYLGLHTWMDGLTASTALTSGVREVCMNTVALAHQSAKQMVRFNHDRWILDRMGRWMADVIDNAEHGLPALAEAMRALADYRLQSPKAEVLHVLTSAYPTPNKPEQDPTWSKEYTELRMKKWDQEARLITDRRQAALELFKGRGTGMDSKAAAGTAWGLYNAVVEVEDWRGGARGNDADARAAAVLVGERAEAKSRAWTASVDVARGLVAV
jgi:hypothetical protein